MQRSHYQEKFKLRNKSSVAVRASLVVCLMAALSMISSRLNADTGTCGGQMITLPFDDVSEANVFFCSIAEAFFTGLTNGTGPTTYSPGSPVLREQMAAFVTRTLDQSLRRGSRRAALDQFWTIDTNFEVVQAGVTAIERCMLLKSDGADLWIAKDLASGVQRVRASDGKDLGEWSGATQASAVLIANGVVYITGKTNPGKLYKLLPYNNPSAVTTLSSALGVNPVGIAYDGTRIWTANMGSMVSSGSISIYDPRLGGAPTNIFTGFVQPVGILFDGTNIWVTDQGDNSLKMMNSDGSIAQTISVGILPQYPVFDGTNIWVPNNGSNDVTVIRASTGNVVATLTDNGLNGPVAGAFDGQRILITNQTGLSVSFWKAADLSPIGTVGNITIGVPFGACSDGVNFWVSCNDAGKLLRF